MCQATIGRWLSVRLQGLGAITLFWTSLAVTVFPDALDAGLAGLAMNYSMQVPTIPNRNHARLASN